MSKLGERFYRQQAAGLDFPEKDMPIILNGVPVPLLAPGQQWNLHVHDPEATQVIDDKFHDQIRLLDPYVDALEEVLNGEQRAHRIEQFEGRMVRGHFRTNTGTVTRLTLEAIAPDEVPDSARERLLAATADQHLEWPTHTIGGVVLRGEGLFSPTLTERYPEELIRFVSLTGLHFDKYKRKIRTTTARLTAEESWFVPAMRFVRQVEDLKPVGSGEATTPEGPQERPTAVISRKLGKDVLERLRGTNATDQAPDGATTESAQEDTSPTTPLATLTAQAKEGAAQPSAAAGAVKKATAKKTAGKKTTAKKATTKKTAASKQTTKKAAGDKKS